MQPELQLKPRVSPGAQVVHLGETAWRLEIPRGPAGIYRLAQLDDYGTLRRRDFAWQPPVYLRYSARASAIDIPGTWGVGLWNDPFSMALFSGIEGARLPALPNTAWFFFASSQNYLSLRDDLPAQGWLAATFQSSSIPRLLNLLCLLGAPLVFIPAIGRLARRVSQNWVHQSAEKLAFDPILWHSFELIWEAQRCRLIVDGQPAIDTHLTPRGPLALVIWIDNQFAAFAPDGRLRWGTLSNPRSAWIEVRDFSVVQLPNHGMSA